MHDSLKKAGQKGRGETFGGHFAGCRREQRLEMLNTGNGAVRKIIGVKTGPMFVKESKTTEKTGIFSCFFENIRRNPFSYGRKREKTLGQIAQVQRIKTENKGRSV